MKFGCALLDPQDLDAVKDIGYDYAEFMGKYLVSLSDGEYAALCKKLESLKLKVLGINGYCPPALKMAGPGFDMGSIKSMQNYVQAGRKPLALPWWESARRNREIFQRDIPG